MSSLEPLMERNFLEYASYVVVDRAIPDLQDGCKPVQRRILEILRKMDDGKFNKVANVIGEAMKLHPHGDASIGNALVVLANKDYFIEKQGNFGNVITGHGAAAARYIECRLTDLARETLFNPAVTAFQPSYDGRNEEPLFLPAKLPVALLIGAEGIAVGMSTKILPHNFQELLNAQIKYLQKKKIEIYPDFPHGGIADVSEYEDGLGKIKIRAKIEELNEKKIVIREIPFSTTTESLIASIEAAVSKGKVKVSSIDDFTTDKVEIELTLPRGTYADDVIQQLYAYTECEVSLSSNIVVIQNKSPVQMKASDALKTVTDSLCKIIESELNYELGRLTDRQHWLTLERIFIENKVYKKIETAKTREKVIEAVEAGMKPFASEFIRAMQEDDVNRLLELRIRRISAYDIEKVQYEFDTIIAQISENKDKLKNLTGTAIDFLRGLLKKYGNDYPRRTKIETFDEVDKKSVAQQNIKLTYDETTGFFGRVVKSGKLSLQVSEYDIILAISNDGSYRLLTVQDKILLPGKLLYCEIFDLDKGKEFIVVYRDKKKTAFGKRVHIHKFIRNKEYRLNKEEDGKIDLLLDCEETLSKITLVHAATSRSKESTTKFDLNELEQTAVSAKGTRLATKPVNKLVHG